jgi:hypothetical protein
VAAIARPIDLRRAVLGRLLASGAPVTIAALVDEMNRVFGVDVVSPKRIADVLRYQVRLGRVRRVDRGVYQVVPGALPKATAWRCLNWRVERDYQDERRRREA